MSIPTLGWYSFFTSCSPGRHRFQYLLYIIGISWYKEESEGLLLTYVSRKLALHFCTASLLAMLTHSLYSLPQSPKINCIHTETHTCFSCPSTAWILTSICSSVYFLTYYNTEVVWLSLCHQHSLVDWSWHRRIGCAHFSDWSWDWQF